MGFPYHLGLPLVAAALFAMGNLCLKRALAEGAGLARSFFINSVVLGLAYVPLWFLEPTPVDTRHWAQPVIVGVFFFLGHLANFLALRAGDVSVATPLMGAKVVFVAAFLSGFFGMPMTLDHWLAAVLTALGVFILGATDIKPGRRTATTAVFALSSGVLFALCDVFLQQWAGAWGLFHFLPVQFWVVALLSFLFIPLFRSPLRNISRQGWKWLGLGSALSAAQVILVTISIGLWHDATGVNVVYGTRGLWSLVFVWFVGHWFGNRERHAAGGRMGWRVLGAVLMMAAVVLAVRGGIRMPS